MSCGKSCSDIRIFLWNSPVGHQSKNGKSDNWGYAEDALKDTDGDTVLSLLEGYLRVVDMRRTLTQKSTLTISVRNEIVGGDREGYI